MLENVYWGFTFSMLSVGIFFTLSITSQWAFAYWQCGVLSHVDHLQAVRYGRVYRTYIHIGMVSISFPVRDIVAIAHVARLLLCFFGVISIFVPWARCQCLPEHWVWKDLHMDSTSRTIRLGKRDIIYPYVFDFLSFLHLDLVSINMYEAKSRQRAVGRWYADKPLYGRHSPCPTDFKTETKHVNNTTQETVEYSPPCFNAVRNSKS